jgi:peptidoglycan/xylan/chitin deacetylase (PgdA/CDA1 family)
MSRVEATAASRPKVRVPILMYHEIATREDTTSHLAVSPTSFAAQLKYLYEAGFSTLTVSGLVSALSGDPARLPERPVVITFDDGFADFHRQALPLLRDYDFTATVFVTTGWIADAKPCAVNRNRAQMLSWSQIREAAAAGIEIGAHSHQHPQLDQLAPKRLHDELATSKALLEDGLGVIIPSLAYPFGYSNARVRRMARDIGYTHAFAVSNAIADSTYDEFTLPRLTIHRSTGPTVFENIVQGRKVSLVFMKERSLTRGYAVVRRTRAVLGVSVRRSQAAQHQV